MIPQRTLRASIALVGEELDPRLQLADIPAPQSATRGLHPIAVSYYSFPVLLRVVG